MQDFPSGPGVVLLAPNARDMDSTVGQETKIPFAATEFAHRN